MFAHAYWVVINLSTFFSDKFSDKKRPTFLSPLAAFHQLPFTIFTLSNSQYRRCLPFKCFVKQKSQLIRLRSFEKNKNGLRKPQIADTIRTRPGLPTSHMMVMKQSANPHNSLHVIMHGVFLCTLRFVGLYKKVLYTMLQIKLALPEFTASKWRPQPFAATKTMRYFKLKWAQMRAWFNW